MQSFTMGVPETEISNLINFRIHLVKSFVTRIISKTFIIISPAQKQNLQIDQ